ncbi:MAG: SDR family NAD(P)-dependent oxidoreductase [Bacteroidota bacterium]
MYILITGSANGIGKAIADQFLKNGHQVIGCDISETHQLQHPAYTPVYMDMASDASVAKAKPQILKLTQHIDVIIHNAGITDYYPLADTSTEKIRKVTNINAFGLHRLVHHFWHYLPEGKGKVISISSESIRFPGAFQPYQISKIALEALNDTLRQELLLVNRQMVIIRPGATQTNLMEQLYDIHLPDGPFKSYLKTFAETAAKYTGTIRPPEKLAQKVYQVAIKKHSRRVYNFYNNPVLRVLGLFPKGLKDYFFQKSVKG